MTEVPDSPKATTEAPLPDPAAAEYYLNRELTWLAFNRRVLHEAEDPRTPLLERLKFVAIVSANLDEFFMKRIGGLKQQIGAGIHKRTVDGLTPREQIDACHAEVRELEARKLHIAREVLALLTEQGIRIRHYDELDTAQQAELRGHYLQNIFPLVTPQAMDPAHPFPFVSNLSLNLLVAVRYRDSEQSSLVRIKVPGGAGVARLLKLGDCHDYVPLDEVMARNLDLIFPGMQVESCECFRVTRNAVTEQDEEQADDLLALIESELRERKFAPIVRLEVERAMEPVHRGMLAAELGLDEGEDVYEVDDLLGLRDLFQLVGIDRPELHDAPHQPCDHPQLLGAPIIFHAIREQGTILLQHPYESFGTTVERFVGEASRDPKVRAIKMTLYRTSEDTRIIDHLLNAARNGKQVAAVVELKARFDEAANIHWANRLEQAGIHVTYGVMGLKTHSKVIFVVRQDYNGLKCYAHIGTGNYNASTARIYTDLGIFSCDPVIGQDLMELFNFLTTGQVPDRQYRKLLPSPTVLKKALLQKIQREAKHQENHGNGLIQFKMNALEDADIAEALYRAAQAGVTVDLIVRDTCRLRPGIPGLSETVRVLSIVGRFLEHPRIYYFRNNGDEEYFIGSADCMKRNLESRVEVVTPVEAPELRAELRRILDVQWQDRRSAWEMQPDGGYIQRQPHDGDDPRSSQEILVALAQERLQRGLHSSKRKPRGIASLRRRS